MRSIFPKAGWMLAGVLALYVLSALAGAVTGGPLDPPGAPAPTLKTLGDIAPSWHRILPSNDGDGGGCGSTRFVCVMGDGVLDNETGLVWLRSPSSGSFEWSAAVDQCSLFTIAGGRQGWRLPAYSELASLLDGAPDFLPGGHPFQNVEGTQQFWTITTAAGDPTGALRLSLDPLAPPGTFPGSALGKSTSGPRAWCVRGGSGFDGR